MYRILISIFIASFLLSRCGAPTEGVHDHSGGGHEGHNHGEVGEINESYTLYNENYELFVEFNPLVKGELSTFLAYFTKLEMYKPVEEGSLTISLVTGKKGVRQKSNKPVSSGIFEAALKPVSSGDSYLLFELDINGEIEKFRIDSISIYEDQETALVKTEAKDTLEGITFLKEQAWKIDFATAQVNLIPFQKILKTSGQILPAQGDEVIVTTKNPGTVFLPNRNLIPGKYVSKGQLLAVVSDSDLTEENIDYRYSNTKAKYEKAKADYERAGKLIKEQIISEKEYLDYKLQFEQAKSNYELIANRYSSKGIKVFATGNGYIKNVYINEGEHLETGDPIVSISKNKRLKIVAEVSQKYYQNLKQIQSANFKIPANNETYSTDSLNGKLISFGKSISGESHLIPIYFEVDNIGDMVSGAFLEVFLKTDATTKSLVVPNSALLEQEGKYFVYMQLNGELFEKKYVTLGGTDGYYTEIVSGLKEGAWVVTKGAFRVKLASSSSAMPDSHAGHVH